MSEGNAQSKGKDSPIKTTIHELPLQDRIANTESSVKAAFQDNPFSAVKEGTLQHPALGDFIATRMRGALTPGEQRLIAETALTTYYVSRNIFGDNEFVPTDEVTHLPSMAAFLLAVDDDVALRKEDKNSIYERLQEDMADHPELAAYIAGKMRDSLNLEEANIVGETALVVYNAVRYYPLASAL